MKLNIAERVGLLGVLPEQGNFVTLRIVSDLRMALSFQQKELDDFGIVIEGDQIRWKTDIDTTADIKIPAAAKDIIVKRLKELDAEEKLTPQTFPLYEKFAN